MFPNCCFYLKLREIYLVYELDLRVQLQDLGGHVFYLWVRPVVAAVDGSGVPGDSRLGYGLVEAIFFARKE